jgi:transcriptional regulator with XRE-family HTH domain
VRSLTLRGVANRAAPSARRSSAVASLKGLAKRSKITPNYISSIERGVRDPSPSTVLKLARELDVEPGALFAVNEHSPAALEAARLFDSIDDPRPGTFS